MELLTRKLVHETHELRVLNGVNGHAGKEGEQMLLTAHLEHPSCLGAYLKSNCPGVFRTDSFVAAPMKRSFCPVSHSRFSIEMSGLTAFLNLVFPSGDFFSVLVGKLLVLNTVINY